MSTIAYKNKGEKWQPDLSLTNATIALINSHPAVFSEPCAGKNGSLFVDYSGFFKVVLFTVDVSGTTKYKIRVVDGASYDYEQGTSNDSLYSYNNITYQIKYWESPDYVEKSVDVYLKHAIYPTPQIVCIEQGSDIPQSNFVESYLLLGSVIVNNETVNVAQRLQSTTPPTIPYIQLSAYEKKPFGIRIDVDNEGKLSPFVNAGVVKINVDDFPVDEFKLNIGSGTSKVYIKVDASGDSTKITIDTRSGDSEPQDSDLIAYLLVGKITMSSNYGEISVVQALTEPTANLCLYQPCLDVSEIK